MFATVILPTGTPSSAIDDILRHPAIRAVARPREVIANVTRDYTIWAIACEYSDKETREVEDGLRRIIPAAREVLFTARRPTRSYLFEVKE
jgi:hypothetical protein